VSKRKKQPAKAGAGQARRRTQATQRVSPAPSGSDNIPDDLDPAHNALLVGIADRLDSGRPLEFLESVSKLASAFAPEAHDPLEGAVDDEELPTYEELVESFMDIRLRESSALLTVVAATTTDEGQAARIRGELAERHHKLPAWLRTLAFEPYRTEQLLEAYGDGDDIMVGVRLPSGFEFTVIAYVEHNLGSLVKDAFVVPEAIGKVIELMRSKLTNQDQRFEELDPADARTRTEDAIQLAMNTTPPFEGKTWPGCRPLVEWVLRDLPAGGRGYERPAWSEQDVAQLVTDFLASPSDAADERALLEQILCVCATNGARDPLHWSPTSVELVMTRWLPAIVDADAPDLAKAPALLRGFIRFAHERTGLRPGLTDETVAAVDRWESGYLEAIGTPGS